MNKANKQRLLELWLIQSRKNHPSLPDYARVPKVYNDNSTNALTKCVIEFLQLSGHQAERINSTGRYIDESKQVTDVVGFTKTIGKGKWIPGTGRKGTADISAIVLGRSVKLEIKFGKDTQSKEQKEYEQEVKSAGGVYELIKTFNQFIEWYDAYIKSIT